jgi:predicted helicase
MPLGDKDDPKDTSLFRTYSLGIATNRDPWVYNFSRKEVAGNMGRLIEFYNKQCKSYKAHCTSNPTPTPVDEFVDNDSHKISWTHNLKAELAKFAEHRVAPQGIVCSLYRPFSKQWLYFNRRFNERVYRMPQIFPNEEVKNVVIAVTGIGATKEFSALITNRVPDLEMISKGQCFPRYYYETPEQKDDDQATLY